jgi:oligoendopeptidase F
MAKDRKDINKQDQWDIEAMYIDTVACEKDMDAALEMAARFEVHKGRIGSSAAALLSALKDKDALWQKAERVYIYARMKRDEDNRIAEYQALCDRSQVLVARVSEATSFFTPEFSDIPEEMLRAYQKEEAGLRVYAHLIDELTRTKPHVLSKEEEKLLAQISELTEATNDTFTMLNNADIRFGNIKTEDGKEVEITHGTYIKFMQSHDRRVRKEVYERMYQAYEKQRNTLATLYNYNTKQDVVMAKIRKYPSAIDAALFGDNVPLTVYENLVSEVNEALPSLHRYIELRKRILKLDSLAMYDVYTPLLELPRESIPYEKAQTMIQEALQPLGKEYVQGVADAFAQRWADVYESEGKTSGAYSFGSYDSMPYLLLNYDGRLEDVFTVIHEMGHSMHSCYTRKTQPFVYGSHSIFTAEVASTVNEALLMRHLLANAKEKEERAYLLNLYLEEFRTTLFRQTMFAEFEMATHKAIEEGETLTATWLSETYGALNKKYYGPSVDYDHHIALEWSRIPHFYNAFYVYKYATGYSAAIALSEKILSRGADAAKVYVEFLKSGESDYPIALLKKAGVDMGKPEPVREALRTFDSLLEQLEELV